jgi:outer membrane protein TolC
MKISKFFAFTGLFIICFVSYSQTVEITLRDAIMHAYKNNPNIIKTENTIDAQESNIRASYGNLFPDLRFNGGWTRTNQVTQAGFIFNNGINIPVDASNTTTNNYSLSLRSDVTLFDGFANYDNVDLAKLNKT